MAPALHFLLRVQHSEKVSRHNSRTLSVLFANSILHFTKLRTLTSPEACTVARDSYVRPEFEKESDSGTSVTFDSARGDSYNVHLVAIAPEMIFYIKLSVSSTTYTRISAIWFERPKIMLMGVR